MLSTLPATLTPSGALAFDEPIRIKKPVRVLVTLLDAPLESAIAVSSATSAKETPGAEPVEAAIAGENPARTAEWQHLLSLREDAIADGMHLMDWDEINAEVRRRQGGATDE
jgi:hypothetical protein